MDPLHTTSWDWIKSFVAVAEQGSVLAAAQHLQTNPATVSRQIAAL
jgi:DNA-binding transcriptional LysR family regulator